LAISGKKITSVLLAMWIGAASLSPVVAQEPTLGGDMWRAKETPPPDTLPQAPAAKPSKLLLKGQINYLVPKGTPFKLKLASVPTTGMRLMDRDLDGNLHPAQLGQEITAKVSEDLYVDDNKVIPEGTVFHGRVSEIFAPRRVGRPGSLKIEFDRFDTPDGRSFAFRAQADNFKPSTWKTKTKGAGIIAYHGVGGAIVGALFAYQIFGLEKTIAMDGYNVAGGAAAGALLAMGFAIMRRGPRATLEPGDELNLAIGSDLLLPGAQDAKPHKAKPKYIDGVRFDVSKSKVKSDGLGAYMLRLDVSIVNDSDKHMKSIDLFVEDSNGERHPLIGGIDEESEFLFTVEPHTEKQTRLYFEMEFPKLKRDIIWVEHGTRQVCYRQNLPM